MGNFLKIALGLGAAAAAAALVISLAKKSDNNEDIDLEEMDDLSDIPDCDEEAPEEDCSCEDCEDWNGEECGCEDDCCTCEECASSSHSLKSAVNSIVDGVMGGVVVAADKLSELSNKLADFVSEKLDERKENSTPAFKFDWSEDDESQECSGCQEGEDSCKCAKEASAGDSDSALGADSGSDGDING